MSRTLVLALFFLAGAVSQAVQALLAREMLVVFYGNELSLGFFYAFWLLWIAVGAAAAGRLGRDAGPARAFPLLAASLPIVSAASVLVFRLCRGFIDVSPTQFVPLDQLALWCLLATLPIGLAIGALFPASCLALGRDEDAPSAYIADAAGGMAGGVIFTFLLAGRVSAWSVIGWAGVLLGAGLAVLSVKSGRSRRTALAAAAGAAVSGLLIAFSPLGPWSQRVRWESIQPGLELVESFTTPYQSVAVAKRGGQLSVITDGKVAASFPERVVPAVEAALIYSQQPKAKNILLIEGTLGGLIPELLRYPAEHIVSLEADKKAFDRIVSHLPEEDRKALESDRVEFRFGDPRAAVNRGLDGRRFDLLISLLPDPATASLNRYYTREYFEKASRLLSDGGVFVAKVTSASNYLGKDVKSYSSSIYSTISSVFKDVGAVPGDTNYFIACKQKGVLSLDPEVLARRYSKIKVSSRRFPPQAFASILPKDRVNSLRTALETGKGELNSDHRPISYYLNLLLWARFSGSEWVGVLASIRRAGLWAIAFPILLFFVLRLLYSLTVPESDAEVRFSSASMMFGFGFGGMAVQIVLIFIFQNFFGDVFEKIGLLNGTFLFGLAVGAACAEVFLRKKRQRPAGFLLFVAISASLFSILSPSIADMVLASGSQVLFCGLVLCSGMLMGAGFPPAFRLHRGRSGSLSRSSGALDSADHLGGVAGGLLTGACFVPLFGVRESCAFAGGLIVLCALPLALHRLRKTDAFSRTAAGVAALPVLRLRERAVVSLPFNRLSWVLFGAVLSVWVMGSALREPPLPLLRFSEAALASVAGPGRFTPAEEPFVHYRVAGGENPGAAAFSSMAVVRGIKGYAGPLNLLLSLSKSGKVLGLELVESRETPSYIDGIGEWLGRFRGLDAARPLRLGREIDAYTGATVTSRAVVEIVDRAGKEAAEKLLGLDAERGRARSWTDGLRSLKFWSIFLLLAAFFPVFLSGKRGPRRVYLGASLLVMGVWHNTLFTLLDAANIMSGRLPDPSNAAWYLLAGFILLTSLLWGQVYCGFLCPFGALQELLWEAGKRLGLRATPEFRLDARLRQLKFVLLSLALALYFLTGHAGWISFNPMQHLFRLKLGWALAAASLVVGAGALSYFRFWCRYFCPAGALLALANKLALGRAAAPAREFSKCGYGVRSEYDVDCVQCQHCVHRSAAEKTGGGRHA